MPAHAPKRERLPNRRDGLTARMTWRSPSGGEHVFLVSVGFFDDGRVGEVFATGPKTGTDIRFLIEDGCVLISNLLQMGRNLDDLKQRLGGGDNGRSTSIIGAIARFAADLAAGRVAP